PKSNPDASVATFVYEKNAWLGGMQGRNGAIGCETHNILSATEPPASVPRLQKKFPDCFSALSGICFQLCAGKTRYTPRCRVNPDLPFGIAADRSDPPVWQAVAFGVGGANTILQPDETAIHSADPQCPGATFVQRDNLIAAETWRIRRIEKCEARAIKACEPPERAYPDIAAVVLQHRIHRVLRQTLFRVPNPCDVLRGCRLCVHRSD